MPALSRKTIRVNDFLPDSDCSMQVTASAPIVAERAMYWGSDTPFGEVAHASIGTWATHRHWYLPDGSCGALVDTWTCVQNIYGVPIDIALSYMNDMAQRTDFLLVVPANTRQSYSMAYFMPPGRYSVEVTSLGSQNLIVESAIYYITDAGQPYKTSGGGTIGAWDD